MFYNPYPQAVLQYHPVPRQQPILKFVNPGQVMPFLHQAVDMRLSSGSRICNAYIVYVSAETDKTQPTYGDVIYVRIIDGKFVTLQNNTQNIDEIGPAGSICGHRPSW
ncbi:hypothetical protein [Paenibacillus apiarius]|uniref:hypothetical protein n=1 Tax=Paenibacillus apiarius TaxID=46240 RepID=UPI003B3ABE99